MAWPDGGINSVTVSVGETARDHATIVLWEADTDEDCTSGWGGGIYASPCSPVGECYDDADFSENVLLMGATADSTHYRTLTVHADERHAGKIGPGATIISSSDDYPKINTELFFVMEWLIIAGSVTDSPISYSVKPGGGHMFRNLVVIVTGGQGIRGESSDGGEIYAWNCVVHDQSYRGISGVHFVVNCSLLCADNGIFGAECYNVIAVGGSGTAFNTCTGDYNISEDGTAPDGGHSITGIAPEDLYVDVTENANLHLKDDETAASGAALDYSASFTIDIDGDTRVDWDIGADEFVSGATDHEKAAGDTEGISDGLARAVEYVRTASDAEGVSDGLTKVSEYVRAASDAEGISDGLTLAMAYAQTVSDSEGVSDGLTKAVAYVRAVSDGEGISDSVSDSLTSGAARSKISCNLAQGSILLGGGMVCRM